MASNITGQLLGLISAGSAFMGNARREAAMSEKRYETKEAATKAAEQKQIAAEQKAAEKAEAAKKKEAEKAAKKDQREIEETAKAENRIAGKEAAKEAREAERAKKAEEGIKAYEQKQEIKKQKQIEFRNESGLTANAEALASKREADAELTNQKSKLVQEQTRGEKSKRKGTYGKGGQLRVTQKAHAQEIAEADAIYQAQQSQEQHTNQKNAVKQLITEAKNIK